MLVGCPPLRNTLYTADNLEGLLAENTRRALNTDRHLKIQGDTLYVTELFKWYQDDFSEASGSMLFIGGMGDSAVVGRGCWNTGSPSTTTSALNLS
ncbi:MAG: hypothetical protein MH213_12690 [Marinobacter sp.]|nr:hypothetical protein [Marinobacter sp.]